MTDLEKKLLTTSIVMVYDNKKKLNDISKILEAGDSMLADKHMSMVMKVIEDYIRPLIEYDTVYEKYEETILRENRSSVVLKKKVDSSTQDLMDIIMGKEV
jgi:hypothetical protein